MGGFGYANREHKEPVQLDLFFRIASISKTFTAVATLQLIEQGKLKLDDRVFKLLLHQAHLPKSGKIDPMFHSIEIATTLGKNRRPKGMTSSAS